MVLIALIIFPLLLCRNWVYVLRQLQRTSKRPHIKFNRRAGWLRACLSVGSHITTHLMSFFQGGWVMVVKVYTMYLFRYLHPNDGRYYTFYKKFYAIIRFTIFLPI